jgi:hypothetical protein
MKKTLGFVIPPGGAPRHGKPAPVVLQIHAGGYAAGKPDGTGLRPSLTGTPGPPPEMAPGRRLELRYRTTPSSGLLAVA